MGSVVNEFKPRKGRGIEQEGTRENGVPEASSDCFVEPERKTAKYAEYAEGKRGFEQEGTEKTEFWKQGLCCLCLLLLNPKRNEPRNTPNTRKGDRDLNRRERRKRSREPRNTPNTRKRKGI